MLLREGKMEMRFEGSNPTSHFREALTLFVLYIGLLRFHLMKVIQYLKKESKQKEQEKV